jgi:nucleotide-binding universal stress UspA family protein
MYGMYKKILVPLDGSELAERVLPHATDLAKGSGAEITLVTVVELTLGVAGSKLDAFPQVAEERRVALRAEAMGYLEKTQRVLREQGVMAKGIVLEGDVASQLITYAEQQGFDLITMATHGRSGIDRFVMGSIAEKVLRSTIKPVLLIRAIPVVPRPVDWREIAATPGAMA